MYAIIGLFSFLLILLSIVSFLTFGVFLIVRLTAKKGLSLKKNIIFLGSSFALGFLSLFIFIVCVVNDTGDSLQDIADHGEEILQEKKDESVGGAEKASATTEDKKDNVDKKDNSVNEKPKSEKADTKKTDNTKKKKDDKKTNTTKKKHKKVDKKPKVTLDTAKSAKEFSKLLKDDDIEKVMIEDGILIITYSDGAFWSETSLFKDFAIDSARIMEDIKDNNNINGIGFVRNSVLIDKKGNESKEPVMITYYDKSNYDEINFENFIMQLYIKRSGFYEVSNGYWLHPTIYSNVKDKELNGLPFIHQGETEGFNTVYNLIK